MVDSAATPWITTSVIVGVTLLIYLALIQLGNRFVLRIERRSPGSASRVATLWVMVRRVVLVVVFVLGLLMILDVWGIGLAPFVALGTVAAAAIGFGAQDVVKDLLAGFFILAEDQYHIGDTVTIAGTSGTVEDIQFRVTVLRDLEGNVHYVPNGQITVASNYTSLYAQPVIDVGVGYNTDLDRAMEVMLDELRSLATDPEWKDRITDSPELLGVEELGDSAIVLRARLTTQADARWTVRREALRRIKIRFDAEGIAIPFPHLTISQPDR